MRLWQETIYPDVGSKCLLLYTKFKMWKYIKSQKWTFWHENRAQNGHNQLYISKPIIYDYFGSCKQLRKLGEKNSRYCQISPK